MKTLLFSFFYFFNFEAEFVVFDYTYLLGSFEIKVFILSCVVGVFLFLIFVFFFFLWLIVIIFLVIRVLRDFISDENLDDNVSYFRVRQKFVLFIVSWFLFWVFFCSPVVVIKDILFFFFFVFSVVCFLIVFFFFIVFYLLFIYCFFVEFGLIEKVSKLIMVFFCSLYDGVLVNNFFYVLFYLFLFWLFLTIFFLYLLVLIFYLLV